MHSDDDLKYFESPEFRKLLADYEKARKEELPIYLDSDDLTDIAEYYVLVAKDVRSGAEALDLALQLHPNAVDPQILKARQYMLNDDLTKAHELCDAICDQENREVYFLRAELLLRENKPEEAFSLLFQAADTIDEDTDYFIYDAAYLFIDYRRFDIAMNFAYALEKISPDWYKTWHLMADVHLGLNNFREALTYIERLLDVDPFDVDSWNWRAEAYSNLGQYEDAMESIDYALSIDATDTRTLQLKAWILMQQDNNEEAHTIYLHLEEVEPDNEIHWLHDSNALFEMGDIQQSRVCVERALSLADGNSVDQQMIHCQYAHVLSQQGQVEEALRQLDLADEYRDEEWWDERFLRAHIYAENGDLDSVERLSQQEQEKYPDQKEQIIYQTAAICFDYGYYKQAYDKFSLFLQLLSDAEQEPMDEYEIYDYLAFAAMKLGYHDEVLKNIRKAVDAQEPHLSDMFAEVFPNVSPEDYYAYYYRWVHGTWPKE